MRLAATRLNARDTLAQPASTAASADVWDRGSGAPSQRAGAASHVEQCAGDPLLSLGVLR